MKNTRELIERVFRIAYIRKDSNEATNELYRGRFSWIFPDVYRKDILKNCHGWIILSCVERFFFFAFA